MQWSNDGTVPNTGDLQRDGFAKSPNQQFGSDPGVELLGREFVDQHFAGARGQRAFGNAKGSNVVFGWDFDAFRSDYHAEFGLGLGIFGTVSPFQGERSVHPSHGDLNAGPTSNGLQHAAFDAASTRVNHSGGGFANGIREARGDGTLGALRTTGHHDSQRRGNHDGT